MGITPKSAFPTVCLPSTNFGIWVNYLIIIWIHRPKSFGIREWFPIRTTIDVIRSGMRVVSPVPNSPATARRETLKSKYENHWVSWVVSCFTLKWRLLKMMPQIHFKVMALKPPWWLGIPILYMLHQDTPGDPVEPKSERTRCGPQTTWCFNVGGRKPSRKKSGWIELFQESHVCICITIWSFNIAMENPL